MSHLLDVITPDEYSMMDWYRGAYAGLIDEDSDYDESLVYERAADIKHVLRFWAENKENLFHLFGDKLVISKEIDYEIAAEDINNWIYDNLSPHPFCMEWRNCCSKIFPPTIVKEYNSWLKGEIATSIYSDDYYALQGLLMGSCRRIRLNKIEGYDLTVPLPNGKNIQIRSGDKWIRTIGKIAKAYNLEHFEDFRIRHSTMIQKTRTKGVLSLSIHPMDFMTMSDNECDWSSCMSWREGGCYRQGTVEMMNSPCVAVAYMEASVPMTINGTWEWNNKKWRQLVIINSDLIATIRPYPYENDDLDYILMDWIKEMNNDISYSKNYFYSTKYHKAINNPDDEKIVQSFENCKIEFWTNKMYNDFCHINHKISLATDFANTDESIDLCYSGPTECIWCGAEDPYLEHEGRLSCGDCLHEYIYCANCDENITDDYYMLDGEYLCENCYERYAHEPSNITEDRNGHYLDNMLKFIAWDVENNDFIYDENNKIKFYCYYNEWGRIEKTRRVSLVPKDGRSYGQTVYAVNDNEFSLKFDEDIPYYADLEDLYYETLLESKERFIKAFKDLDENILPF